MFFLSSQLGDEKFYAFFFSFWFWNIDGAVGRRVILIWNLVMYIGQGMKDIVRWPRPSMPPVVKLESKATHNNLTGLDRVSFIRLVFSQ